MIIHEDKDSVAHLYGDYKVDDGMISVKISSKDNYKGDEILQYKILSDKRLQLSCVFYYMEVRAEGGDYGVILAKGEGEGYKDYKFYKTISRKLADLLKTKKQEKENECNL